MAKKPPKAPPTLVINSLRGKRIIALDLGRRTGWCVYGGTDVERHKDSGVYELYPETRKGGDEVDDGDRFVALAKFLTSLDDAIGGAEFVTFEQVNGGTKGRQTVLYNGYRAIVLEWARRLGKQCLPVPVQHIKQSLTGSGGADKHAVMDAVRKLGHLPFDDNESDAIGCMYTAIRLSRDGQLEQAVRDAEHMHLEEFKAAGSCSKVLLTLEGKSPTIAIDATAGKNRCSSDSAVSARQAKRQRRMSLLNQKALSAQSSPRRSRRASVPHLD